MKAVVVTGQREGVRRGRRRRRVHRRRRRAASSAPAFGRARRARRDPAPGDRRDQRLRARRRAGARAGVRPARRRRLGAPRLPRDPARHLPRRWGTQRAARLIGPAKTKDLIWSGRHVRADEALAIGLVDRVVPADEVLDAALEWAGSLASGAVVAMGLAKRAIDGGLDGSARRRTRPRGRGLRRGVRRPRTPRSASAASSTTAPARPPSPASSKVASLTASQMSLAVRYATSMDQASPPAPSVRPTKAFKLRGWLHLRLQAPEVAVPDALEHAVGRRARPPRCPSTTGTPALLPAELGAHAAGDGAERNSPAPVTAPRCSMPIAAPGSHRVTTKGRWCAAARRA